MQHIEAWGHPPIVFLQSSCGMIERFGVPDLLNLFEVTEKRPEHEPESPDPRGRSDYSVRLSAALLPHSWSDHSYFKVSAADAERNRPLKIEELK